MRTERRWSALLTRPIPMSDGRLIRSLGDAKALQLRTRRDRLTALLDAAAETGTADDIERVTGQLEIAVFAAGKMQL